jgi:hypothetical protein
MAKPPPPDWLLILGFVLRFGLAAAAMLALWQFIGSAYVAAFRGFGQRLCAVWSKGARVDFALRAHDDNFDLDLVLYNPNLVRPDKALAATSTPIASRHIGYTPTVLFIALVVATPVPWRRRILALGLGLPVVHLAIGMDLFTLVCLKFANAAEELRLPAYSPFQRALTSAARGLFDHLGFSLTLVLLVWAVTMFRSGDWTVLADRFGMLDARRNWPENARNDRR